MPFTPADGGCPDPSELLDIAVKQDGSTTVLTVRGEIDLYTAPLLRKALHEAIERTSECVVDLSDVTFMASSGLAALIRGLDHARSRRCELRLAGGGRAVRRPLQAAGLEHHFEHYPSTADAVRTGQQQARRRRHGQDGSVEGHTVSSRSSHPAG
jgi:anti-sigma B factor antagonist